MVINKLSAQVQLALRYENLLTPNVKSLFIKDRTLQIWEIIVRYVNTLEEISSKFDMKVYDLGQGYAQVIIGRRYISELSDEPNVIFISLPQFMEYIDLDLAQVCAEETSLPTGNFQISGRGLLLAVIDSGIDYTHPDFRNDDDTTRILYLWDQGIEGGPPLGFADGTLYTKEQIDEALKEPTKEEMLVKVPSMDLLGHGTALAGIAGGNGRGSVGRRNRGMAPECDLLIVKVGKPNREYGPRDLEIMQGIRFAMEKAKELRKPLVILLGSGYNLASHNGEDILAAYIGAVYRSWVCNIVVGVGNEGNRGSHGQGNIGEGETKEIQFIIDRDMKEYACCIWKPISDEVELTLESPTGEKTEVLSLLTPNRAYLFDETAVLINFSEPVIDITQQQILIVLQGQNGQFINSGLWRISLRGKRILQGNYNIWGSIVREYANNTRFLEASIETTLTCPADSEGLTGVGAYNGNTIQLAAFSGRGYTADGRIRPNLVAPGVNVTVPSVRNGELYTVASGTSIAAAFVAGAYILMQSYGIIQLGNPGLYGDALEVYLIRNAKRPIINGPYPNNSWGFGILCLEAALNNMREVANQTN
ncbi:S8 family peptidase [Cellulosilyticum lentocellum]|uniref:Peptidase S8 and S53 subtilisin kexin sedolisin n=1 Tax=Cellulosilyticum lentocellum (strain ATCC 49066 / DSM 5427 / NCIMB 11756 / RHM5) TaxID=642492 RepID=F2JLM9_CELLD|nr:S8 family peptidase [Cellulosilyticum lentocellum]ADZ83420.1 peptidase S8 and S53 subtilisin kexin sedolisin [Cellulosilyticum lentocellum DSM 5427]